jgi:gephyrin
MYSCTYVVFKHTYVMNIGLKYTPLAVLSRPVVGTRYGTLICTLPGSVKAVRENIKALGPLLPRIMELIATGTCEGSDSVKH